MSSTAFNPKIWTSVVKIGMIYLQRGINNFASWAKRMTEDAAKQGIQKELIEPWQRAVWESLKTMPNTGKFNNEQISSIAEKVGKMYETGTTDIKDIEEDFTRILGADMTKAITPMIQATYAGIQKFFDDQKQREAQPAPEKLRWKVEGKTLTVGGAREIPAYSYGKLPWVGSVNTIQHIVIEEGVEKISANAFSECTRLELLTIPASVKTIGDCAFKFCYCGNRDVNGGKNVIWSLDDGVLTFKKNPAARNAADFSIGVVSWRAVDKNISGVKLERDVIPDKKFFDWRKSLSRDVPVSM